MIFDPTFRNRPLSHSQLNTWAYSKEDWYNKYILNKPIEPSPEMEFGKKFAEAIENGKPLAPVTLLPAVEHKFEFIFSGIHCVGYADTFDNVTFKQLGEYKTGNKIWDKKRVDDHEQFDFYCLGNYIINKVKPDDMSLFLECVQTKKTPHRSSGLSKKGEYTISLKKPIKVYRFETKRTMADMLKFCNKIKKTVKEMEEFCKEKALSTI